MHQDQLYLQKNYKKEWNSINLPEKTDLLFYNLLGHEGIQI